MIAQVVQSARSRQASLEAAIWPYAQQDLAGFNTRAWKGLGRIVQYVGKFRKLEAPLMALGVQFSRSGFKPGHFRTLRAELLRAMAELLGEEWTPEVRRDWEFVLAAVSGAMLRGALQGAGELQAAA